MDIYSLKELQNIQLQILIDFDRFCMEHKLRYYLIGGALLGAVRYQKFIPWDDDVDVAMPREDYERLKQVYSSEKYFLQNAQSDPQFSRCIQKIRRNGTVLLEKVCADVNMHKGIYIDIFPIDYVEHNDTRVLSKRAGKIRRLTSLRSIKGGYDNGRYRKIKNAIRWLLPLSAEQIDRRIDELCTKENDRDHNYGILWLHNYSWDKQIHKIAVFGEGGKCRFCERDFSAPTDTDAFLRRVFGQSYMEEPAPEKRVCPHRYINVDTYAEANEFCVGNSQEPETEK